MPYEIELTNAEAILTAVIRGRVPASELSKFVPAACGEVWSFIRSTGLPRPGRHVALYLDAGLVEVGRRCLKDLPVMIAFIVRSCPVAAW
jgi:hypothetical protein